MALPQATVLLLEHIVLLLFTASHRPAKQNCEVEHFSKKTIDASSVLVKIAGPTDQWMGISTGPQDILLVTNES